MDLTGAIFEKCTVGINPSNRVIIFIIAACLSLFAGYIAMLAGTTVQALLAAKEPRLRMAGFIICGLFLVFIAVAIWRGLHNTSLKVGAGMLVLIILIGLVSYFTEANAAGVGALYGLSSLLLVFAMLIIGAVARATAGTLQSTILFLLVALGGGMFAKSLGGGIGTLIMAIATAIISKKALANKKNSLVKYLALRISASFGTSFKNANLYGASFKNMAVNNCKFDGAVLENVKMINSTSSLCYYGTNKTKLPDAPQPV